MDFGGSPESGGSWILMTIYVGVGVAALPKNRNRVGLFYTADPHGGQAMQQPKCTRILAVLALLHCVASILLIAIPTVHHNNVSFGCGSC